MMQPDYDLTINDLLQIAKYRISMLENFIAMNKNVRDDLLKQEMDMTNLDEYLVFMANLDRMMAALQEKKNSLENQG
jgi:hypothetical protein